MLNKELWNIYILNNSYIIVEVARNFKRNLVDQYLKGINDVGSC